MTLTPDQANAIADRVNETGETMYEAAEALGITVHSSPSTTPPSTDPWAANVAKDSRIDLEKLSDNIERAEGVSQMEALKRAIRMEPIAAAPLIAEETKRFEERATATARRDWELSAEGIETMGRARQAEAAQLAERAAAMRVELEARGVPVDGTSDAEIVGIVEGIEAKHAAAKEANDLQANIAAATKGGDA